MALSLVENIAFNPEQHSTDECLKELEKYGFPKISKIDNYGWYASLNVFVSGKGVEFKVASEFKKRTPKDALNQCYSRLIEAMEKIKET